jgi:hypothetical protein
LGLVGVVVAGGSIASADVTRTGEVQTVSATGSGSTRTITVPEGEVWCFRWARTFVSTTSDPGGRDVELYVRDPSPGTVFIVYGPGYGPSVGGSLTFFHEGYGAWGTPPNLVLHEDWSIQVSLQGFQTGDGLGLLVAYVDCSEGLAVDAAIEVESSGDLGPEGTAVLVASLMFGLGFWVSREVLR